MDPRVVANEELLDWVQSDPAATAGSRQLIEGLMWDINAVLFPAVVRG